MKQMVATEEIEKLKELQPIEPGDIDEEIENYLQDLTENPLTYVIGLNNDGVLVKGIPSGGKLYRHSIYLKSSSAQIGFVIINDVETAYNSLTKVKELLTTQINNQPYAYVHKPMCNGTFYFGSKLKLVSRIATANDSNIYFSTVDIDTTTGTYGETQQSWVNFTTYEDIVEEL